MLLNENMERIEDVEMHATLQFRRVTDEPKAVKSGAAGQDQQQQAQKHLASSLAARRRRRGKMKAIYMRARPAAASADNRRTCMHEYWSRDHRCWRARWKEPRRADVTHFRPSDHPRALAIRKKHAPII